MSPRDQMITTAIDLFQKQGYQATSWRKLVEVSGAPWGSAHHYFPGGKEQLGVEAVEEAGRRGEDTITRCFVESATVEDAVQKLFAITGEQFAARDFRVGCPIAIVTLEMAPHSPALTKACAAAFESWRKRLIFELSARGYAAGRVEDMAVAIMAMLEGCLVLARASRSPQAFDVGLSTILSMLKSDAGASRKRGVIGATQGTA